MSNAGQDDVDRALAAAGVPAMRYFNFRNLRFVRDPGRQPVEVLGANAADRNLHDIRPPGLEPSEAAAPVAVALEPPAGDGRPAHVEPHFGYEPTATAAEPSAVGAPELAAVVAEETSVEHLTEPAQPVPGSESADVMAQEPSEPARLEPEPPPADLPETLHEGSAGGLAAVETASLPPTSPPPVDPPPAPPPPASPPPPTVAAEPAPLSAPPRIPEPVAASNHPAARGTSARVIETEAPMFDVEPDAAVAAPVAPIDAPAEWSRGTPTSERGSLSKMFTALTDRGETRPRAPTWGLPEPAAEAPASEPDSAAADTREAARATPEFRLSDFRMSERPPALASSPAPPVEAAEPVPASPAIFGLAERLASRPQAGAVRSEPLARPSVTGGVSSATGARATRPVPLRRPDTGGVTTAESLFRRL